jgi:hypothetical protein
MTFFIIGLWVIIGIIIVLELAMDEEDDNDE